MLRRLMAALLFASTVCVAAALAFLRTEFVAENLCAYAVATIEEATHARVRVASCQVDAVKGSLVIDGLKVGDPGGTLQIEAARVFAQVEIRPIQQKLRLVQLHVDHPDVKLVIDSSGPSKKKQRTNACLPEVLDRFELGRVTVRRASLDLMMKQEGVRVQVPRIAVRVGGKGDELSAAVATRTATVTLPGRSAGLISLRADAKVDLRGTGTIDLSRADVIGTEAAAYLKGRLEDLCNPRIEATANVRVDDLGAATARLLPGVLTGVKGGLQLDGLVRAEASGKLDVHGDVRLKGIELEGLSPGEAKSSFTATAEKLSFTRIYVPIGKGDVQGTLEIAIGSKGTPMTADVSLRDVELAELLRKLGLPRSHVVLNTNGKVHAHGPLSPLHLRGEASLDLGDFAILDRRFEQRDQAERILEFPTGHIASAVTVTEETVSLADARLQIGAGLIRVEGDLYTDPKKGLDLRARTEAIDLGEFKNAAGKSHLGPIPWAGKATLAANVKGPYADVAIGSDAQLGSLRFLDLSLGDVDARLDFARMQLLLSNIDGRKGETGYSGEVRIDFDKDSMPVEARLQLAEGSHLHDLVDLAVDLVPTLSTVQDRDDVDGLVSGVLHARGPVARPDAFAHLSLSNVHLWGQLFADGEAQLALHGGERLQIQKVELRHTKARDTSTVELKGRFGPDWVLEMDARTLKFDLADLDAASAARLKGPLAAYAKIRGVASHPVIDAEAKFFGGKAGKANLGDGNFTLRVDGKAMVSHGTMGPHVFDALARLEGDFGFTTTLALRFDELAGYFATFAPGSGLESGLLSADVSAQGSLLRWRDASGTAQVTRLGFKWTDPRKQTTLQFDNERNGQLAFGPRGVEIQRLSLVEAHQLATASVKGTRGKDGSLDLRLSARMDGKLLLAFSQGGENPSETLVEHAAGMVDMEAGIGGTEASPTLLGGLRVQGGELRVRGSPFAFRELNGKLSFTQNAVLIEDLTARLNNGPARISGSVRLQQFAPESLDLQARFSEVALRLQENLSCTLEEGSHLALHGPVSDPTLSGMLILARMKYAEDINLERQLLDFTRRAPTPRAVAKNDPLVHFNVDVHLSRGVRIENNLARTDLKGEFTLTGTSRRPGLLGSVNTVHGTATFRGNEFQIEQGVINFTDRQSIRPSFDLQAISTVKDYKIRLHAFGTPQDPRVSLVSEPALAEADLAFLLTFGFVQSNIQAGAVNATDTGTAIALEALNKVTGFSDEVRRFIPKNAILRNPTIDFTSDFSVASNRVEPMARFHSQFLSEKLDLKILQGLSTRRGRGVISYRLSDALTAQGSVDNEHIQTGTDLGLDLSLRWEGN